MKILSKSNMTWFYCFCVILKLKICLLKSFYKFLVIFIHNIYRIAIFFLRLN